MTRSERRSTGKEIADSLAQAVVRALVPGAPTGTFEAASDAAQLLGLPGLDRLLQALASHAEPAWPRELNPAVGRLERLAAECARAGDIEPLRAADRELAGLAAELEAIEWSATGRDPAEPDSVVATLGAEDVLADLSIEDPSALRGVRLVPSVAAALRAALDWLAGEHAARRRLTVSVEDGVLQVTCDALEAAGLRAAHDVLAAVGGNFGPAPPGREVAAGQGRRRVRVPTFASRHFYLMIHQGGIPLALPWHSVLQVHVAGSAELAVREQGGAGITVLAPLSAAPTARGDRPVVLIGHGLQRAYLVADRLVWRLEAESCPAPGPVPAAGLDRTVRTEDGELYWVADPAVLLAGVPLPALAEAPLPPLRLKTQPSIPRPAPETRPTSNRPEARPSTASATPRLRVLEAHDVETLAREVAAETPAAPPTAGPQSLAAIAQPEPDAGPAVRRARRALVAEDSLTARMFLTRMLEQHGFEVTAVTRGAELLKMLEHGPWALLCVDVELPDTPGPALLREVAARGRAPLVALIRDRQDLECASAAGISRVLRKPFDPDALEALVQRLAPARGGR